MMFSLQDIAKLQAAGYSLDDILAFNSGSPAPQPEQPDPQPAPQPEPQPEPQPQPAPQPEPQPAPQQDDMLAKLDELIQQIKTANIRGTGFPAPEPDRTAEQVLAQIINPPAKAGKSK